jgi:hypothetical protein
LQRKDIHLVAGVIRDAEKLKWLPGQLETRKRAVKNILQNKSRENKAWKRSQDDDDDFLMLTTDTEDALFRRKGWNQVDSGFSLWGNGRSRLGVRKEQEKNVDEFLESKGWNDVDSGFRIF